MIFFFTFVHRFETLRITIRARMVWQKIFGKKIPSDDVGILPLGTKKPIAPLIISSSWRWRDERRCLFLFFLFFLARCVKTTTASHQMGENRAQRKAHVKAHAHFYCRPSPPSRPAGGVNENMATRARILALRVVTKDQW